MKNLRGSSGALPVPIVRGHQPVGVFHAEYLFIHPFEHPNSQLYLTRDMMFKDLNIGHRGSGQSNNADDPTSYKSVCKENTIFSFVHAAKKGVDFVEFDVLLTKDRIPVVYHDFKTRVSLEKAGSLLSDTFDLDVNQLTLAELRGLKLDFATTRKRKMFSQLLRERLPEILALRQGGDSPDVYVARAKYMARERIKALKEKIPTLAEVFENVPLDIGFNVEIKYPVPLVDEPDADTWEDMNSYIDAVLKVIFEHVGTRKIVISCFEPDICSVSVPAVPTLHSFLLSVSSLLLLLLLLLLLPLCRLKLKQPRYPVFLLTTAGHPRYGDNKDARANSVPDGVLFAKSEKFAGIVCYSTPLLEKTSLINFVKQSGLLLFTWGEANNVAENKKRQRELGVDAVISDNASEGVFRQSS